MEDVKQDSFEVTVRGDVWTVVEIGHAKLRSVFVDGEGDEIFEISGRSHPHQAKALIHTYLLGHQRGRVTGEMMAKHKIQQALGLGGLV